MKKARPDKKTPPRANPAATEMTNIAVKNLFFRGKTYNLELS
jgi:hypothetical protein